MPFLNICIAFLFFSSFAGAQSGSLPKENKAGQKTEDPQKVFATQCGIDLDAAKLHIFINSSKGWKEYQDLKGGMEGTVVY